MRRLNKSRGQINRIERKTSSRRGEGERPPTVGQWILVEGVDGKPVVANVKTGKVIELGE